MKRFHNTGNDDPRERRGACRYRAVEDGAWIGWWNDGTFRTRPARLLNVSLQGSLILADEPPDRGQPVWLNLRSPGSAEWVESSLVNAHRMRRGQFEARLAFFEACPYGFFKTAVYGRDALAGLGMTYDDPRNRDGGPLGAPARSGGGTRR